MSVRQAASRLGISASKLYELVARRGISHYRIGGKLLFDPADLDAYLASCRIEASQPVKTRPPGLFKHLDASRLAKAWAERGVEPSP